MIMTALSSDLPPALPFFQDNRKVLIVYMVKGVSEVEESSGVRCLCVGRR